MFCWAHFLVTKMTVKPRGGIFSNKDNYIHICGTETKSGCSTAETGTVKDWHIKPFAHLGDTLWTYAKDKSVSPEKLACESGL